MSYLITCKKCKQDLHINSFYTAVKNKTGIDYVCKSCRIKNKKPHIPIEVKREKKTSLIKFLGIEDIEIDK